MAEQQQAISTSAKRAPGSSPARFPLCNRKTALFATVPGAALGGLALAAVEETGSWVPNLTPYPFATLTGAFELPADVILWIAICFGAVLSLTTWKSESVLWRWCVAPFRRDGDLRDAERQLQILQRQIPDAYLTADWEGRVLSWNPAGERLFGFSPGSSAGVLLRDLLPDLELPRRNGRWAALEPARRKVTAVARDGRRFTAAATVIATPVSGGTLFSVVVRDLSGKRRAAQMIREQQQVLKGVSQATSEGLWVWDLAAGRVQYSPRWSALLGYSQAEISSDPAEWLERIHPEDREVAAAELDALRQGYAQTWESEMRLRRRDGHYRWMQVRARVLADPSGRPRRLVGAMADITPRKWTGQRLLHAALHDPLTGLPNRAHLLERLEAVSRRVNAEGGACGVLVIDVNRFKRVNECLGHLAGDQLLISISRRLQDAVRRGDSAARIGTDQFAVLLDSLEELAQASEIAADLQQALQQPHRLAGQEVFASVRIGVAVRRGGEISPLAMLQEADATARRARESGRRSDGVANIRTPLLRRAGVHPESELQRALQRDEFFLHYQPIVSLASGEITGCEALIRWRSPEGGIIPPSEFIPDAEEAGLIMAISEWLLGAACRQSREWQRQGLPPVSVSVNVSPVMVTEAGFTEMVGRALRDADLDASRLHLEVTEHSFIENAAEVISPLAKLCAQGVQISLDDFGAGCSSLHYLRRFPLNAIKIDETFIRHLPADSGDAAIAAGLISIAHNLGLKVVVEGVETNRQLAFLREHHCDFAQGYFLSPPLAAPALASLLANGPLLGSDAGPLLRHLPD